MNKIYRSNTAIFYNKDCGKYGVLQIAPAYILDNKQLYKWTQIAIGEKTYTKYKKVSIRWAKSVVEKGILEVRVDMINNKYGLLPEPLEFIN